MTFTEPLDCELPSYKNSWSLDITNLTTGVVRNIPKKDVMVLCEGRTLSFAFGRGVNLAWLPNTDAVMHLTGVRDLAGNPIAAEEKWAFKILGFSVSQVSMMVQQITVGQGISQWLGTTTGTMGTRGLDYSTFSRVFCQELMDLVKVDPSRCMTTSVAEESAGSSVTVNFDLTPGTPSAPDVFESVRKLLEENSATLPSRWQAVSMNSTSYQFATKEKPINATNATSNTMTGVGGSTDNKKYLPSTVALAVVAGCLAILVVVVLAVEAFRVVSSKKNRRTSNLVEMDTNPANVYKESQISQNYEKEGRVLLHNLL